MKSISCCAFVVGTLLLIPLLSSCGGSTSNSTLPDTKIPVAINGPGQTTVSVAWPQPTASGRLIPLASQSVRVRIFNSDNVQIAEQLLVRPESNWWLTPSTATITGLPVDTVRVVAEAFPERNGFGTVQARGTTSTPVVAGDNPALRLRLDSTVDSLTASPIVVGVGQDTPFTITARNAEGEIVLESPDAYSSSASGNPAIAIPLPGFQARGYTAGKTTFTLYNKEALKSISFEVQTVRTTDYRVAEVPTDWTSKFDACYPTAINKNGSFVGYCYSGSIKTPSAAASFVAVPNPPSAVEPYTIKPLKAMEGYSQVFALDINDRGYIVGRASNGDKVVGFLRPADTEDLIDIGNLGGNRTVANSISNDAVNTVVGASQSTDGNMYAIRYVNGNLTRLDNTPSPSIAYAINDKGGIAGTRLETNTYYPNYWDANGGQSNVIFGRNTYVSSINNYGEMVGYSADQHETEDSMANPVFWSRRFSSRVWVNVPSSWGYNIRALGINDNGVVVGSAAASLIQSPKLRAIRWINNGFEDLNNMIPGGSGWDVKSATALNNNGYIVGVGSRYGGPDRLCVLIPQDTTGGLQVGVD